MLPYIIALSPVIYVLTNQIIIYMVTKSEAKHKGDSNG